MSIRPMTEADAPCFADRYTASAARPGAEKFESMTAARASYLLDIDRGQRGFGLVGESSDGVSMIGGTIRQEASGEVECFGPYVPAGADPARSAELLAAFAECCAERSLVPSLWLSEHDADRLAVVARLGWRTTAELQWLRHPTPIRNPGLTRFGSNLRLGDARADLGTYLQIYNEGFANHVGDVAATMDDISFKMADPLHQESEITIAYVDDQPAGAIEYWRDTRIDGTHVGWITNIIVRVPFRSNLEIVLSLGSNGSRAMSHAGAVAGKGLLDPQRTALSRLYLMLGCTVHDTYAGYAPS